MSNDEDVWWAIEKMEVKVNEWAVDKVTTQYSLAPKQPRR